MTDFFTTLMHTNPIHIFLAVATVLVMFSGSANSVEEEEDDNSDYVNASWNPNSVNYNG